MNARNGLHLRALKALRSERRIGPHFKPEHLRLEPDGALLVEGEVESVAQKRLSLERLAESWLGKSEQGL